MNGTRASVGSMPIQWDERGLCPAVAQDAVTGAVLMVAWMNADSLALTRTSGTAHFYSRSRGRLWQKGETSGNTLAVREVRYDCDADTLLVLCDPAGPACHTGRTTCFHNVLGSLADGAVVPDDGHLGVPAAAIDQLARTIEARRDATATASYTRSLLDAGMPKILAKLAEEQTELAVELEHGTDERVVAEAADLLYHLLVGLAARRIPTAQLYAELERRAGTSGHAEKAARKPG